MHKMGHPGHDDDSQYPDDEPYELDRHAKEPARLLRQLAQVVGARDLFYSEGDSGWTQAFTASERRRIARTLNEIAVTVNGGETSEGEIRRRLRASGAGMSSPARLTDSESGKAIGSAENLSSSSSPGRITLDVSTRPPITKG